MRVRRVLAAVLVLWGATVPAAGGAAAAAQPPVIITYAVGSAGSTHTDLGSFADHVAGTLADPDGWSLGGTIGFALVSSHPSFTIRLTTPAVLGGIGGCSATWSCRVGATVYINEDRWNHATPTWTLGLDAYRHYVVNHEVGHFLGLRHVGCPGAGQPAPVMMQQSKGSGACRFNVWPLGWERQRVAARFGVPVWEPSAASMRYVATAYLRILQRWPDRAALHRRAIEVDHRGASRTDELVDLFTSGEFQARAGTVIRLYLSAFARPVEPSGLLYWGGRLHDGYPPRSMAAYLAASPEFAAAYGSLDDPGFVDRLYRNVLHRSPDAAGLHYWVGQLGRPSVSRGDLFVDFSESSEHRRATATEVPVVAAYDAILDRRADSAGLGYWTGRLATGTSLGTMLAYFRSRPKAIL